MWWLLAVLVAYIAGWVLAIPGALRRRMTALACSQCGTAKRTAAESDGGRRHLGCSFDSTFRPRGAMHDRSDSDIAVAISMALLWLPLLPLRTASMFLKNRYLTAMELERRNKELQQQIEKLTRELNK